MSALKQRRQRDILLTTLIDLLVQILFLLLVALVIVSPKDDAQKLASQAEQLVRETGKSIPEISEVWRRLVDPDTLKDKYLVMEKERDALKVQRSELEARLKTYEARFNALGDKPCWMTTARKPVKLLRVQVFDDGINVMRAWPDDKDSAARDFKVPLTALQKRITVQEFMVAFRPVFEESKKNNCRHYADLEIFAESGMQATDSRGAIENYFYPGTVQRGKQ